MTKPTVAERVMRIRLRRGGMFIAARGDARDIGYADEPFADEEPNEDGTPTTRPLDREEWIVHGALNTVSAYKTLRGAKKAAGVNGIVLLFDPTKLPVVDADAILDGDSRLDELQFAERQSVLWAERAAAIERSRR